MKVTRHTVNRILNDPYIEVSSIYRYFNGNVPIVKEKPEKDQFALTDDTEEKLKKESSQVDLRCGILLITLYILGYIATVYFYKLKLGAIGFFDLYIAPFFTYGWIALVLYSFIAEKRVEEFCKRRKQKSKLFQQYQAYTDQLKAYKYWSNMKSLNYWMALDGHQFENEVAKVFRAQGYQAQVSRQGGDGGVDIVLKKADHKIAVQCKAHKNLIGPSVARELYGTMLHLHYEEGIIVSRSGFTLGVQDFVKGKNIKLINMHDLLNMQNYGK